MSSGRDFKNGENFLTIFVCALVLPSFLIKEKKKGIQKYSHVKINVPFPCYRMYLY